MDPEYFSDNRLSLVANENCKIRACKPPRIEDFPPDLFTQEQRYYGGVAFHFLICLHIFCALTVVCDDYFVSSLTRITKCLKLKPDVAGATFMAVGSSAPTLFISIISTFFTEGDIGLGTIVGSTIFNTLFIIALCGIGAGLTMHLTWYPIFRDSIMYILSVLILMFSLYDRKIHWYESVALFVAYTLYIIVMYFNDSLEEWAQEMKEKITKRKEERESKRIEIEYHEVQDRNESTENPHEYEETENRLKLPKGSVFSKAMWIFTLPSIILLFFTIPDCRKKKWEKFYLLTFTSSAIWMGGLSYVLVWMVSLVGYTYNIPECVLGMTFLAAGSSLPDAIASLVVAKLGRGDMAVSNCIGSNVFDMLCLGITWLIKTTIISPNTAVYIQSENIFFTSGILIASILCTILLIVLNKWKLDERLGVIFLVMYLLFLGIATFIEVLPCC